MGKGDLPQAKGRPNLMQVGHNYQNTEQNFKSEKKRDSDAKMVTNDRDLRN